MRDRCDYGYSLWNDCSGAFWMKVVGTMCVGARIDICLVNFFCEFSRREALADSAEDCGWGYSVLTMSF